MKALINTLLLVIIVVVTSFQSSAQQDTITVWNIITEDGNEFNGTIITRSAEEITLQTEALGTITIQVSNISKMTAVDPADIHDGEVWLDNPQESRYFWAPSSYGLRKGEGYYQNVWILFNHVAVGITDNISIGAGIVPLFLFAGGSTPVWITPKFSIPIVQDKFNLGGGALLGAVLGEGGSGAFGVVYGTSTFGGRDKNATLGLGYGFADGEWSSRPTITLSGMFRTGKRGYFLTENYFLGSTDVMLISLGGRVVWQKISLDYGAILPFGTDVDTFVIIPWVGFVIPFGK